MSALGIEALEQPRKTRISPRVREAVRLMVDLGRKRSDAAQAVGITDDGLYRALERPDVRAYRNHLMQVFRESAASRSLARIDTLADTSTSESVKFESSKLLLAFEGISPIAKSENLNIHKGLQPGLVMNLIIGGPAVEPAHQIDGLAHQSDNARVINGLPQPVLHPSMTNALPAPTETKGLPAKRGGRAKATRGEK